VYQARMNTIRAKSRVRWRFTAFRPAGWGHRRLLHSRFPLAVQFLTKVTKHTRFSSPYVLHIIRDMTIKETNFFNVRVFSWTRLQLVISTSTLLIRLNIQNLIRHSGLNRQYEMNIKPPLDCTSHTNLWHLHPFLCLFTSAILNYQ